MKTDFPDESLSIGFKFFMVLKVICFSLNPEARMSMMEAVVTFKSMKICRCLGLKTVCQRSVSKIATQGCGQCGTVIHNADIISSMCSFSLLPTEVTLPHAYLDVSLTTIFSIAGSGGPDYLRTGTQCISFMNIYGYMYVYICLSVVLVTIKNLI